MKVYFISGHRDITQDEFEKYYVPLIDNAISLHRMLREECRFVVGDYHGVDIIAQEYLKKKGATNVTVYHMFDKPRNNAGFNTIGGFTCDEDRDAAMTQISDEDIAWVRPGKEGSGTDQNIERRKRMKG